MGIIDTLKRKYEELTSLVFNFNYLPIDATTDNNFDKFTTVDWVNDSTTSTQLQLQPNSTSTKSNLHHLFQQVYFRSQSWLVVVLVGISIGSLAYFVDVLVPYLFDLKLGYCTSSWYLNQKFCCLHQEDLSGDCLDWYSWSSSSLLPWNLMGFFIYLAVSLALALTSVYLVLKFAPNTASGSGIPQIKTILGGFLLPHFLNFNTLLIKLVSLILAVGSGLSLGNLISKHFEKFQFTQAKNREILSAASAAGVAVAFGSPIGGVLYSLEELSSHFPMKTLWRSFFSALVATVVLHGLDPFRTGKIVMFMVQDPKPWSHFEIPTFAFIGLLGGLYGVLTMKIHRFYSELRTRYFQNSSLVEVGTLSIITVLACYWNPYLKLEMSESMALLFKDCHDKVATGVCDPNHVVNTITSLLSASFIRFLLVAVTYGSGVPTGIFIPSMAIGACFGRAIGMALKLAYDHHPEWWIFASCTTGSKCISPGTYAFLGAAAALCGVTKMTVSVVVILFELTGAVEFILPTMITVIVSKAVGDTFFHGGIADQSIRWKGYPYMEPGDHHLNGLPVAQAMQPNPKVIPTHGWKLDTLLHLLDTTTCRGFPVVDNLREVRVNGYVTRKDLLSLLDRLDLGAELLDSTHCFFQVQPQPQPYPPPNLSTYTSIDFGYLVNPNPFLVHPKLRLETVATLFHKVGPQVVLIELQGKLVGLITKKDLLNFSNQLHTHPFYPKPSSNPRTPPNLNWSWNPFLQPRNWVQSLGRNTDIGDRREDPTILDLGVESTGVPLTGL